MPQKSVPLTVSSPIPDNAPGCNRCKDLEKLDFDVTFAYQPIVDIHARAIFAHEVGSR